MSGIARLSLNSGTIGVPNQHLVNVSQRAVVRGRLDVMYINDLGVTRVIVGGPNTIPPQSRRKRRPNDLITVRLFMYLEQPECTNSIANATIINCLLYLSAYSHRTLTAIGFPSHTHTLRFPKGLTLGTVAEQPALYITV